MSETTCNPDARTTNSPDPWTESGYSQWAQNALSIRWEWMKMMGFSRDEIEEHCRHCPPANLDEEMSQYNAMFDIQAMNG